MTDFTLPPHELTVPLIQGKPLLSANQRLHWAEKNRRTRLIRENVRWRAVQRRIGPLSYVIVQLHFRPPDNRRRDPSNLVPSQKPAVDGLVDAGVVPDDTPQYVGELMPVIHRADPSDPNMWLAVAHALRQPTAEELAWIDEDSRFERAADAAEGEDR